MTGRELRALRVKEGLTQQQLAELTGTTRNTIARQERGESAIREPMSRLYRMVIPAAGAPTKRRPWKAVRP